MIKLTDILNEMGSGDLHYRYIIKLYEKGDDKMKAKIAAAIKQISGNKHIKISITTIESDLLEMSKSDIIDLEKLLNIDPFTDTDEELNENKVDYYIDKDENEFQTVDVNYLQNPGHVEVKYVGSDKPIEYKGNFEADLKSGIVKRLNSKIDEAFFIGEDDIDEYDVENVDDMKEFLQFMKEYKQTLAEAECGCVYEAEYHGREVSLGKPMQGDIKKFKVYVKNPKGKVVKVNFGFGGSSAKGKRMSIKKNNPKRRKAFRARHNCANPGPRTKARYWSCRKW